jgi:hypothetical protein
MRRTAVTLLAVALLGTPALVGPASADSRSVTIGIKQASGVYTSPDRWVPLQRACR